MKNFKFSPKTIIILIVAFFVVVGLLAAIAALSAKKPKTQNTVDGFIPSAQNSVNTTNTVPTSNPSSSSEPGNEVDNTTPRRGRSDPNNAFEDYFDSEDLLTYFENSTVNSMVAYSAAGGNMEKLKEEFSIDEFYAEEIKDDDLEDMVKLLKKAIVKKNLEEVDIEEKGALNPKKFIVVDEIFYFGMAEDYIYSFAGDTIEVFQISGKLSDFANKMPETIDTDFDSFAFSYEEKGVQVNFDDEGIVKDLKTQLYSYKVENLSTEGLDYVGKLEFDNDDSLDVYMLDEYALGEYKSGKKKSTVIINKDFISSIVEITENALN